MEICKELASSLMLNQELGTWWVRDHVKFAFYGRCLKKCQNLGNCTVDDIVTHFVKFQFLPTLRVTVLQSSERLLNRFIRCDDIGGKGA